ncbi:unnamed protein product [Mycena citricolor]|uniref:Uncharacterized protein n=1 Tax=Mycena citricolor TaxID=2018698 RepID=A0AAD2K3Q5_9AGAR|nr:unnamed protein product [Mycena citricolor]
MTYFALMTSPDSNETSSLPESSVDSLSEATFIGRKTRIPSSVTLARIDRSVLDCGMRRPKGNLVWSVSVVKSARKDGVHAPNGIQSLRVCFGRV